MRRLPVARDARMADAGVKDPCSRGRRPHGREERPHRSFRRRFEPLAGSGKHDWHVPGIIRIHWRETVARDARETRRRTVDTPIDRLHERMLTRDPAIYPHGGPPASGKNAAARFAAMSHSRYRDGTRQKGAQWRDAAEPINSPIRRVANPRMCQSWALPRSPGAGLLATPSLSSHLNASADQSLIWVELMPAPTCATGGRTQRRPTAG